MPADFRFEIYGFDVADFYEEAIIGTKKAQKSASFENNCPIAAEFSHQPKCLSIKKLLPPKLILGLFFLDSWRLEE